MGNGDEEQRGFRPAEVDDEYFRRCAEIAGALTRDEYREMEERLKQQEYHERVRVERARCSDGTTDTVSSDDGVGRKTDKSA
jgi:outer membrane translocation and assembly module TamA